MGERWAGEAGGEIQVPIDRVWDLVSDFYSVNSWVPLVSCTDESGRYVTEVGCRRTLHRVSPDESDEEGGDDMMAGLGSDPHFNLMVRERLLSLDHSNYTFTYTIEENNLGLTNYHGECRLWEGSSPSSTYIRWSFEHDPIDCPDAHDPSLLKEQRISIIENILHASISMLESALRNSFKH